MKRDGFNRMVRTKPKRIRRFKWNPRGSAKDFRNHMFDLFGFNLRPYKEKS